MARKIGRETFQQLIREDLEWLAQQPRTLERDHIELALKEAEYWHYDLPEILGEAIDEAPPGVLRRTKERIEKLLERLAGPHGD